MNVKPLNDRVLVKRIESEERSAGGIIIPDTAKEKPQEGTVIAVGPGKLDKGERIALNVAIGDRVLFGKYSGTEVNIAGVEHTLDVLVRPAGNADEGGHAAVGHGPEDGDGVAEVGRLAEVSLEFFVFAFSHGNVCLCLPSQFFRRRCEWRCGGHPQRRCGISRR